jgi:hypothetical protein
MLMREAENRGVKAARNYNNMHQSIGRYFPRDTVPLQMLSPQQQHRTLSTHSRYLSPQLMGDYPMKVNIRLVSSHR